MKKKEKECVFLCLYIAYDYFVIIFFTKKKVLFNSIYSY